MKVFCSCNVRTHTKNVYRKTGKGKAFAGRQSYVDISCQNSVFKCVECSIVADSMACLARHYNTFFEPKLDSSCIGEMSCKCYMIDIIIITVLNQLETSKPTKIILYKNVVLMLTLSLYNFTV